MLHRAVALSDGHELQIESATQTVSQPPDTTATLTPNTVIESPNTLPVDLQRHLDLQERDILIKALQETGFNRTAAAARLGLSLRQIRYRIARLNIDMPQDHDAAPDAS
jgi:two-component system response regulator PilR (NtrC family)